MSKFLQSRASKGVSADIYDSNLLTTAALRSLIPGNFYLMELQSQEGTGLQNITTCFLLLHEKAIFVLQQCHQSGIIHGDVADENWTCFNYLGDGKPFENPLLKNEKNIALLAAIMKLPEDQFHNCVLFDNECELRRIPGNTEDRSIIWADQVEPHFAALLPKLPVRYSHTQLEALHDIFVLVSAEVQT